MANVNPPLVSLAEHPRAARGIRSAKAAGGLLGFAVVAVGSWMHHAPLPDTLLRALVGGIAGNMLAWFGAIVAWHHVLEGEAAATVRRASAERQARAERAAAGHQP
jgi:uncharacterized membrane protein YccC